jgi:hypothetical protein
MENPVNRTLLLSLCFAGLVACGDKDAEDTAPPVEGDTDTDTDADTDADADADADADTDLDPDTVFASGTAAASTAPLSGGTTGILCLAVVSECPSIHNMGAIDAYDGVELADVDLGSGSVAWSADFSAQGMTAGTTYAVNGYLETDAGACDVEGPSWGELVTFGPTACPTFVWTPGEAVSGLVLDLNFAMPF